MANAAGARVCGCGRHNRPERRYCGDCGTTLVSACSGCGFANDAGDRFCGQCAAALAVAAAPRAGKPSKFAPIKPAAAAARPRPKLASIKPASRHRPRPQPEPAPAPEPADVTDKLIALNRARVGPAGTPDLTAEAREVSDELAQDQIDALFSQ